MMISQNKSIRTIHTKGPFASIKRSLSGRLLACSGMIVAARSLFQKALAARGGPLGMLQTGLAQVGIVLVNIGTGVLTARILGPTGRGELAAVLIWLTIPSLVATAGLQSGLIFLAQKDSSWRSSLFAAGLILGAAVFVPALVACLLLLPAFMHDYTHSIMALARFGLFAAALNVVMTVARQSLLGSRNTHYFNLSSVGTAAGYLILLLVAIATSSLTPTSAVLAQVGSTIAVLLPTLWAARRTWEGQPVKPFAVLATLARYSVRAAPVDLATAFYWNIDRLVLVAMISPAQFGFYAVATSFARVLGTLQAAVSSVALADMSNCSPEDVQTYVHRTVRVLFWCLLPACIIGWISSPVLLPLVYGHEFTHAVVISRVLLVESAISCIAQLLVEAYLASNWPVFPTTVQAAFCAFLFGSMFLLAPLWGGFGAALAMLLAAVFKIVLLLAGLKRINVGLPGLTIRRADWSFLRI